jgi:hypothetical protein
MRHLIFSSAAAVIVTMATPAAAQMPPPATQKTTTMPPAAHDDDDGVSLTMSTGIDYSSGRYGGKQTTDILVGLTDILLTAGNFQFSAGLPYLNITGPAYVVVGAGGVPVIINPARGSDTTVRDGWGDLNLSAAYSIQPEDLYGFEADLTGRAKIATADASKGLSSGESDFGFSVDVSRQMDIWTPFVTFGYRVPGSPRAYSLNSSPSFSVGTSVQLYDQLLAIVSYDFDGSISQSLADSQQLSGSLSWVFNDSWTLTAYVELGMSSGAPTQGTGLLLGWKVL